MQNSGITKRSDYILPITVIGILFFIFGFVTWLNGILIPFLRTACELNDFEAYFVTFAFYISYFVMALPSSQVLKFTGFRNGMTVGLWIMALGATVFIPAALTRSFALFLTGLFVQGTGLAILQTASNPYITILGPRESAAQRISIMGIANKVAGMIAPVLLASIVLKDAHTLEVQLKEATDPVVRTQILDAMAHRVIEPYIFIAVILLALGFMIRIAHLPEVDTEAEDESTTAANVGKNSVFAFPNLVLGVIALFFYVGVEVIAGDSIIRYGQSLGISMTSAKYFTSLTLLGMVIGYLAGIVLIPKVIQQSTALKICAALGIVFSLAAILTPSHIVLTMPFRDLVTFQAVELTIPLTVLFIALLGIANSLVWPAIWPLAINGLGRYTKTASAMLIMAIAGGALLPLAYGKIAVLTSTQKAYWILVPSYFIILAYSIWGYKITSWKKAN